MIELIQTYVPMCEMPLLCVIVFALFLIHLSYVGGESGYASSIRRVLFSAAVFAFVYALWDIIYFSEAGGRSGFYTVNFFYNVSAYVMLCFFYHCSLYDYRNRTVLVRIPLRVCHVLFAVLSAVYWLNINTGLFVTPSHTAPLDMGPLDILWYAVVYLPALILFAFSLYCIFDKRHYAEREHHAKILAFTVVLIVSAFLDQYLFEAHVLLVGLTAAMLCFYLQSINSYISLDDLTGLYNRRQFLKDMETKSQSSKKWGVIMLDLNGFKNINDTYGHNEGDVALQSFAGVLKHACRGKNARPYRYGGDEFVIVKDGVTGDVKKEIRELQSDVLRRLQLLDMKHHRGYVISCATGTAVWKKNDSVIDMLKRADEDLYSKK